MNQTRFAVVMEAHVRRRLDPEGQDTSQSARPDREYIKKQPTEVALILGSPHPMMAAVLTDAPTRAADSVRFLAPRLILLSGFTLDGFVRNGVTMPPLRFNVSPTTKLDSADARKTWAGAMSAGCAALPIGDPIDPKSGRLSGSKPPVTDSTRHVGIGATTFRRMPRDMRYGASPVEKLLIAPLMLAAPRRNLLATPMRRTPS